MNLVKNFKRNEIGKDYVVGDIHGCFTKLRNVLHEVKFDRTKDRLFSVGDLVDRGLESEQCIQFLQKPWFHAVMGNHEKMAIDYFDGKLQTAYYVANGGQWFVDLPQADQNMYVTYFRKLPIAIEVETENANVGIIHAECPTASWNDLKDTDNVAIPEMCIWSRDRIKNQNRDVIHDIDIVYVGHTPVSVVEVLGNVVYIDTGAVFAPHRELTILELW